MKSPKRLLLTIAVMMAVVLQVLDITIVNVALPYMQGSFSASPDQITWVLTSYLVSSAIFMPLTGYFTDRLGRKRYLLFSIAGFVTASALCGASESLSQMVLFRLLQGMCGAGLVPLSQAILVDTYALHERGKAMALWGIGVMVAPILGPTLGGYLTDTFSWRWNFYINVPLGLLSFLLSMRAIPDTEKKERGMDWTGLILMSVAIGGLQLVLDRGNQEDWFSSRLIQVASVASAFGLAGFLAHSLTRGAGTLFNLRIFTDRNFALASLLIAAFGLGMYGNMAMQPLMLEGLLHYPAFTAGLVMAPRGLASMLSMILVGRLVNTVGPQRLVAIGIAIAAFGTYAMTWYSLDVDPWWIVWPILVQGFGMGMVFVPLSVVAFATLPKPSVPEATGLYSLLRTVGASVGIAIVATVLTRQTQVAWNSLSGHVNAFNPAVYEFIGRLRLKLSSPLAPQALGLELGRQSQMVAFIDVFMFITWSFLAMLPLVFMLRRPKPGTPAGQESEPQTAYE